MTSDKIVKRYAKALFDLAVDTECLNQVQEDMKDLRRLLQQSQELSDVLASLSIPADKKVVVLQHIFEEKLQPLVYRFLLFLVEKRRISLLSGCCQELEKMFKKYQGILDVSLITARELEEPQLLLITEKLQKKFGNKIEYNVTIDSSLLGGFRIIIGDHVLDCSLQTQLTNLKQKLIRTT